MPTPEGKSQQQNRAVRTYTFDPEMPRRTALTQQNLKVLRFLVERRERFPTYREICAHMGWAENSSASHAVRVLHRAGYVDKLRIVNRMPVWAVADEGIKRMEEDRGPKR